MVCNCGDPKCSCYESCSCAAALCLCFNCMKIRLNLHISSQSSLQGPSEDNQNVHKLDSASTSTEMAEKQHSKIKIMGETQPVHDTLSQANTTNISRNETTPDKIFYQKIVKLIYKQGLQSSPCTSDAQKTIPSSTFQSNASREESSSKEDGSGIQKDAVKFRKRSQSESSLGLSEKGAICPAKKYKPHSPEREPQPTFVLPNFSTPLSYVGSSFPSNFSPMSPTSSTSNDFIFPMSPTRSTSKDFIFPMSPTPSTSKDFTFQEASSSSSTSSPGGCIGSFDVPQKDVFSSNAVNIYRDDNSNPGRDQDIQLPVINVLNNPLDLRTNEQGVDPLQGGLSSKMLERLREFSSRQIILTETQQEMALSIAQSIQNLD